MKSFNKFDTSVINLEKLHDMKFRIPTYQRPYVWKELQISKLLNDCSVSFINNPDNPYFIGTVLTCDKTTYCELIDGQQRFTTLWLIAVVFHKLKIESSIVNYLKVGKELRIGFEIRKEIEQYFDLLEKHPEDTIKKYSEEELNKQLYLKDIAKAVTTIEGILLSIEKDSKQKINLKEFGDFLYKKVFMINNVTPKNIDLNKLFATINNSGIQLEQTDIVKSNLLKNIKKDKLLYSKIWEVCENMDDFFERNIRKSFVETNWDKLEKETFNTFDRNLFLFQTNADIEVDNSIGDDKYTIRHLIDNKLYENSSPSKKDEIEGGKEEIYSHSILSFGQLLLHTYRIYLAKNKQPDFEGTFHVNRLIEIFRNLEKESENKIKEFFEMLWQVRYTFDANVIKWIVNLDSKEEHLELTNINKSKSSSNYTYFGRNVIDKSNELMLQSVLYFTGDYLRQYWLTPYLYRIIFNKEISLDLLEKIDNVMSLSTLQDKEISYKLCNVSYEETKRLSLVKELELNKGTGFKHYWFQKLEYVLWKSWTHINDEKFKNYRISSKNSVEHVYPQKPEFKDKLSKEIIDNFGNLALLNVGQNSSYSNQEVSKKKIDFYNKRTYDSLKLFYIYKYDNWDEETINKHSIEMISELVAHYVSTENY